MFPNFFSGESGSLTSLFFGVCFLCLHLCAKSSIRDFVRDFGSNFYTISHDARREDSGNALMVYAFLNVLMAHALQNPTLFGFVVWLYGAVVAWWLGEAFALHAVRRRITIQVAREQIAQGHFNPPPPAQISYMDEPPAHHSQKWRAVSDERHNRQWGGAQITGPAQQDDDAFAFDPDRFKR